MERQSREERSAHVLHAMRRTDDGASLVPSSSCTARRSQRKSKREEGVEKRKQRYTHTHTDLPSSRGDTERASHLSTTTTTTTTTRERVSCRHQLHADSKGCPPSCVYAADQVMLGGLVTFYFFFDVCLMSRTFRFLFIVAEEGR